MLVFILAFAVAILCSSISFGAVGESSEIAVSDPPQFYETVDYGEIILEGTVIERPFEIRGWSDHWEVNGERVEVFDEWDNEEESRRARRGNGGGRRPRREVTPIGVRTARNVSNWLEEGRTVVLFQGFDIKALRISDKPEFFSPILADQPSRESIEQFELICPNEALTLKWRQMIDEIEPTAVQRTRWTQEVAEVIAAGAEAKNQIAAVRRFESFSYAFTVIAMLIGTVSLGHMLSWSGKGFKDSSPDAMKSCAIAVALMVGLSVIDLLWTIMAAQAGQMREMNPLAAQFVDYPWALTSLKVASIIVSGGIFFCLRRKRVVQRAAWWMCLVLVLVTFRWAVFGAVTI